MEREEFQTTFKEAFWEARKVSRKKESTEECWQPLISLAESHGSEYEKRFAQAAELEKSSPEEALKRFEEIVPSIEEYLRGYCYFLMGSANHDLSDYTNAIVFYKKAIDDPKFDTPGNAWFNMGHANSKLSNYETAIECYKKALEDPKYDTLGIAWYNMGNAHKNLSKYEKAIECYEKAIEDPKYDSPSNAWNNMGNVYKNLSKYEKAIECYEKALDDPKYEYLGTTWYNMGDAYRELSNYDNAIECYAKAEKAYEQQLDYSSAEKARLKISELRGIILNRSDKKKIENSESKESSVSQSSDITDQHRKFEKTLEAKLKNVIAKQTKDIYQKYHGSYKEKEIDSCFIALRETSSSVCFVPTSDGDTHRGGGYFLRWEKYGIVIDPGFDFLRNFHEAGFHIKDIDVVLISHDHPDHNLDLEAIDNLFYEMSKKSKKEYRYTLLCDNETHSRKALSTEDKSHREVCPFIHGFKRYFSDEGFDLRISKNKNMKRLPFRIQSFKAKHTPDVPNAVGFKIECFKKDKTVGFILGYTGDTEYYPELPKHLSNCDILLANMSQPDTENELNHYEIPSDGNWSKKKNHLGYYGTIGLIREAKPKLAVIGEFWEGLGDARIEMIRALRTRTENNMVIPADRGMEIDIANWKIKCSSCGEFKEIGDLSNFRIVRPAKEFDSLRPVCKECIA